MTDLPQRPKLSPREIFCQLLSVQDETQCHRLLERLCEGDSELISRVQLLLDKRHEAKHGLLANAVGIWKSETDADISQGLDETSVELSKFGNPDLQQIKDGRQHPTDGTVKVIGPYELEKILGEGGMGTVYLARQTTPVQREVALKVIRPERESPEAIARFAKERQALATMEHPNIAQIFDGGVAEDGSHYFAMELVRGVPITEYCETSDLTIEQRLNLFSKLCLAVQHAHSKNLVHRDLKPSNILVGEVDGQPILKVIDFGIAKSFGESADHDTLATQVDQILGTPLYFAPEQVAGDRTRIDNRTDVYALGIVLYELLTGVTPLDRSVLAKSGYRGVRANVRRTLVCEPVCASQGAACCRGRATGKDPRPTCACNGSAAKVSATRIGLDHSQSTRISKCSPLRFGNRIAEGCFSVPEIRADRSRTALSAESGEQMDSSKEVIRYCHWLGVSSSARWFRTCAVCMESIQ